MKNTILFLLAGILLYSCTPHMIPCICIDSRDYKIYKTVTIGEQTWMAENMAYLPSVSLSTDGSWTEPYYYVYGYEGTNIAAAKATDNYKMYGVLYNWVAAMAGATDSNTSSGRVQGICPEGWHLPSDAEWTQLATYLADNGYNYDGTTGGGHTKVAKALASIYGWNESSAEGAVGNTDFPEYRNKSRFSALPGGYCSPNTPFKNLGICGYWWSTTESNTEFVYIRRILYNMEQVMQGTGNKICGFSVRCVKD